MKQPPAIKVSDRTEARRVLGAAHTGTDCPKAPAEQYKILGLWQERNVDRVDLAGGAVILVFSYKCLRCGVKLRLEIG